MYKEVDGVTKKISIIYTSQGRLSFELDFSIMSYFKVAGTNNKSTIAHSTNHLNGHLWITSSKWNLVYRLHTLQLWNMPILEALSLRKRKNGRNTNFVPLSKNKYLLFWYARKKGSFIHISLELLGIIGATYGREGEEFPPTNLGGGGNMSFFHPH